MHRLAAVIHINTQTDVLLLTFARDLQAAGFRVGGLIQLSDDLRPAGTPLALLDLSSGRRYVIEQNSVAAEGVCSVDTQVLAEAGGVLRAALANQPPLDLILMNRFGALEAAGQGLRAEISAVFSAGVPMLLAVPEKMLVAWQQFCGDLADTLPAQRTALERWWRELNVVNSAC